MAEANRCLYCADAPCIKACPTAIDVPTFIRKIATGNVRGAARTILDAEHPRRLVRRSLPGRGALRGRVRVQRVGARADQDRAAPALRGRTRRSAQKPRPLRPRSRRPGKRVALRRRRPGVARGGGVARARGAPRGDLRAEGDPGRPQHDGIAPYKMKGDDALARDRVGARARGRRSSCARASRS